ncbi:DUF4238 domain-containing protein [Streptomyces sp. NPDC091267]|uniref:DUF4238 domain-containing protein n=1 Tax=Streptomyces sp. NPDC091267 TaxID=3155195 RepID=UPI003420A970
MPEHAEKHHFVPLFLLHRFAGPKGQLVARQVMSERRFPISVRALGHRNFGHSICRPGQEPDHVSMEAAMGNIEGGAATVVGSGCPVPPGGHRPLGELGQGCGGRGEVRRGPGEITGTPAPESFVIRPHVWRMPSVLVHRSQAMWAWGADGPPGSTGAAATHDRSTAR